MRKLRLSGALEFGNNLVRQCFAEFYTPLVERVDVPDRALHEDFVLVQRDNFTQRFRRQAFREDSVGRTVTFTYAKWDLEGRAAFCRDLPGRFSEGQRLRLRDHVGNQEVVVRLEWVQSLVEPDEVTGDQFGSLVDKLVESVLAVGPRVSPDNRTSLIVHLPAFQVDMLPVALQVALERGCAEVLIYRVEACKHLAELLGTNSDHQ